MRAAMALPRAVRRFLAGKPIELDGQTLDVDAQLMLRVNQFAGIRLAGATPEGARTSLNASAKIAERVSRPPMQSRPVRIPARGGELYSRLYIPNHVGKNAPMLVFFHGGGWVVGNVETHDDTVRFLAQQAGVRALSVDYRLAPEHPFPAAVEDAVDTYEYVVEHAEELGADPNRIAVGGDSAGGNLAAVVAQQARDTGGHLPAFQLLIYPEVDFVDRRASRAFFKEGFFLTDDDMNWFEGHYVPAGTDKTDPRLSPLLAKDLSGLPPAAVITAGFDPLRDNGEAYYDALKAAGVPVTLHRHWDMIHGFVNLLGLSPRFREATMEIAGVLRTGLDLTAK
ncbi:MAG: alpha/beta hydrolase fold domain-containing protein [Actinophytocola sp.]|nr:alpha/beta hydrolase fold domain-containing protein [Actinophytocola sp.]